MKLSWLYSQLYPARQAARESILAWIRHLPHKKKPREFLVWLVEPWKYLRSLALLVMGPFDPILPT